eukprot:gnl/TRDRNA2_/TRDRNA2_35888_c0_seq1.p1 gnl/TRDRNA2_/TRDRNA2_35888_c0~~gnl/TRDRNA2_/TRDRNA2_35888_c0_seq1.p1  ORF type:complete len:365 (+),score=59.91 gnl/TRDRNA2_/TRDRNA2_35888_c0_seq1:103-1197(+)
MVEGDGCHRVAAAHRKSLVGRKFVATSPNRRFVAGAKALMRAGGVLLRIEVHGKNLFYFFGKRGDGTAKDVCVVHIHFGMAGAFAVYREEEPETTANTRLRLVTAGGSGPRLVAHLSAMTVEHGTFSGLYQRLAAKLGPDPLRRDADPERFVSNCVVKKSIGEVLMDQKLVAGVGNIYRSETLYAAGIHPTQPANTLLRNELLSLWSIVVKKMQAGFQSGSIWGKAKGPSCYGLKLSACGGKVRHWEVGGRTVYACGKRQLLDSRRPVVQVVAKALPRPGTEHLGTPTRASVAEARKRKAGESLAVQHVALKDDATRRGALKAAAKRDKRKRRATGRKQMAMKKGARASRVSDAASPAKRRRRQ